MASYDFSAPRLYIDAGLAAGVVLALDRNQQNYLGNVLRLSEGDTVLVFNGRDGEWRCASSPWAASKSPWPSSSRRGPQTVSNDLHYLFAPLKHAGSTT